MSGELIFGIHAVESALTHDPKNIIELYIEVDSQNARLRELSERARDAGVKPHARDRAALDRMTGGARHQGAVARYRAPPPRAESELYALVEKAEKETLLLVLDGVTDPHNLGACLRSAEGAGATAVVVPKDKAVGITPTVRRASASGRPRGVLRRRICAHVEGIEGSRRLARRPAGDAEQDFYSLDLKGRRRS